MLLSDVMQFKLYSKVNELYRNANMTEPLLVWGLRENFFHPPPNAPTRFSCEDRGSAYFSPLKSALFPGGSADFTLHVSIESLGGTITLTYFSASSVVPGYNFVTGIRQIHFLSKYDFPPSTTRSPPSTLHSSFRNFQPCSAPPRC